MKEEIKNEIKKVLHETSEESHKFFDIKDIKVTLIDYTPNFYKSIVNASMMTWTRSADKWSRLSAEARFEVVKQVLERKALPLALEMGQFVFMIENVSRSSYDQIARKRISTIASMGTKDDDLNELNFMVPSRIKDTELEDQFKELCLRSKKFYRNVQKAGIPNWCARSGIPLYYAHNFVMRMDFLSLSAFCSSRMESNEQEDTVCVSWLMRERIKEVYPLLAEYLRPSRDWAKKELIMKFNGFSNLIGIPHVSDIRWSTKKEREEEEKIAKFHESCSNTDYIMRKLKINIPDPNEWVNYSWEILPEIDKEKFRRD